MQMLCVAKLVSLHHGSGPTLAHNLFTPIIYFSNHYVAKLDFSADSLNVLLAGTRCSDGRWNGRVRGQEQNIPLLIIFAIARSNTEKLCKPVTKNRARTISDAIRKQKIVIYDSLIIKFNSPTKRQHVYAKTRILWSFYKSVLSRKDLRCKLVYWIRHSKFIVCRRVSTQIHQWLLAQPFDDFA